MSAVLGGVDGRHERRAGAVGQPLGGDGDQPVVAVDDVEVVLGQQLAPALQQVVVHPPDPLHELRQRGRVVRLAHAVDVHAMADLVERAMLPGAGEDVDFDVFVGNQRLAQLADSAGQPAFDDRRVLPRDDQHAELAPWRMVLARRPGRDAAVVSVRRPRPAARPGTRRPPRRSSAPARTTARTCRESGGSNGRSWTSGGALVVSDLLGSAQCHSRATSAAMTAKSLLKPTMRGSWPPAWQAWTTTSWQLVSGWPATHGRPARSAKRGGASWWPGPVARCIGSSKSSTTWKAGPKVRWDIREPLGDDDVELAKAQERQAVLGLGVADVELGGADGRPSPP